MDPHAVPVGSMPAVDCQRLVASREWSAYSAAPSPATLGPLRAFAESNELDTCVIPSLARLFVTTSNWRTAQHLARECIDRAFLGLGLYYARRALELSGDDVIPRMTVVRAYWEQRFCEAALYHADIANAEINELPEERRQDFELELADLYANIYLYLRHTERAIPWIHRLLSSSRIRGDTLCLALRAFHHDGEDALAEAVAVRIAPYAASIAGRDAAIVKHVLRRRLLRLLKVRPA